MQKNSVKNKQENTFSKNILSWFFEAALSRNAQQGSSCALGVRGPARVRNITNANADINLPSWPLPWRLLILFLLPNLHFFLRSAAAAPRYITAWLLTESWKLSKCTAPSGRRGSFRRSGRKSPGRKTMTFKPSGDLLKQPRRVSPAAAEPDRSSAHCIIGLISAGRPWAPPPAWYTNNITRRLECNSYWAAWQIAARPGENWKSWRGLRYLTVTVTMMKYPPVTVVDFAKYERSP